MKKHWEEMMNIWKGAKTKNTALSKEKPVNL